MLPSENFRDLRYCDDCFLGGTKVERWQHGREIGQNLGEIGQRSHFPLLHSLPCHTHSLILGGFSPTDANHLHLERPQSFNADHHFAGIYISQQYEISNDTQSQILY